MERRNGYGGRPLPTLVLAALVLLAAWMGGEDGGYFARDWGSAALIVVALALVVSLTGPMEAPRWGRRGVLASGLLASFAGWTLASLVWSPNRGDAWLGSGQTVLYALAFPVALALVARGASRRWAMAASVVGPAAVAAFTLLGLGSDPGSLFEDNRLVGTVGYYNGEAAFLLVPFWVAIYLGGSRRVGMPLRALALAGAVLCLDLAVLAQSRGAMVAMAASLPVFFLFSGQRLRGLLALAPVAVALFLAFPGLNDVYLAALGSADVGAALEDALPIVWAGAGGAGVYGALWALADGRWRVPDGVVRLFGSVAMASVLVLVVVGSAAVLQGAEGPGTLAREKWEAFKTDDKTGHRQSRYLSASGTGRFELWEVAWKDFRERPLLGVGTQNYDATYYRLREQDVGSVRQPHMLPLEVLAERGVVGAALFFGFLGACLVAGLRGRFGGLNPEGRGQVGALMAAVAYWFVHSSAEWFWQMPAVTLPAILYLALLCAPWRRSATEGGAVVPSTAPFVWPRRAAFAGAALACLAVVLPLYLADRGLARSYADPGRALAAVEQAQRFDPLNPRLPLREAELATEGGEWERAEDAYRRAIELNPEHYAPYVFLAAYYEGRGKPEKALVLYREASALNPLDEDLDRRVQALSVAGAPRLAHASSP